MIKSLSLSLLRAILIILSLILIVLSFAASTVPPKVIAQNTVDQKREKISSDVLQVLEETGSVRVVIALASQLNSESVESDLNALMEDVAILQASVLSSIGESEFQLTHRYQAVPALVGIVRDKSALNQLASDPLVLMISLDVGGTGGLANSVPLVRADIRHDRNNTGSGIVVAVLDSGIDTDHPDLTDDIVGQLCFGDNDGAIDGRGFCPNGSDRQSGNGAAEDDAGHGTHVSGIITSDGIIGSPGLAPGSDVLSMKVLNNCSFSGCFWFFSEIVAALDEILVNWPQVNIINMSLGTFALFPGDCDSSTAYNMAGAAAVNSLRARGVVLFASSGNDSSADSMASPACLNGVIAVGASDASDNFAPFSNTSSTTDIFAPGVAIVSSAVGGTTVPASGTSMASPTAAGCAALLIESGEAMTPDDIEARLKDSLIEIIDPRSRTFPRIDCGPSDAIPGDCNGDGLVDAGDLSACILEIFDGDGTDSADTPNGSFAGDPIGCDSNADGKVDAGDLSCTILTIFNGPGACSVPAASAAADAPAELTLPD